MEDLARSCYTGGRPACCLFDYRGQVMKTSLVVSLFGLLTVTALSVAAEPKSAKEAMQKGKTCFEKGDYEGAVTAYAEAIKLDPKNAEAY